MVESSDKGFEGLHPCKQWIAALPIEFWRSLQDIDDPVTLIAHVLARGWEAGHTTGYQQALDDVRGLFHASIEMAQTNERHIGSCYKAVTDELEYLLQRIDRMANQQEETT
ncbi:hypothetical protein [uncultured Paraglaciecola sp.]|uniref:hypothetical protein n=1 Tax=uncultured Paraglaciecola sp. TaxID=1765024 RepID=UPI002613ED21|nr:hypothetical protein [uncultured Paraglaciecola sp.]